ncbi:MAG: hypothetical protein K2P09_03725 [Erysipelotrichales bacterium]|nr:hypothetical protein [Erysipelotrichales bacterium]
MNKIGKILLSALLVFSSFMSNFPSVNAKESNFLIREYETGYKTDKGSELIKLRVKGEGIEDYKTHWGQVAFCIEHGMQLPTGEHSYDSITMTDTYKNAGRIAYLSSYRFNNGESGGNKRYAYTQNLIWQILGQTSHSYNIDSDYPAWKEKIMDEYNKWDIMPSFNGTTQTLDLGESITLTDSAGVIKYYDTFDYTKDGINFKHTKGQNSMIIMVGNNCTKENVMLTYQDAEQNGISKYAQVTGTANFVLRSNDTQDMICSPGYTDPRFLRIAVDVNLYGSLEIVKKDNRGNDVPNVSFKISNRSDMSDPLGTYTTGSNGKVTIDKLKPGTIYVQETKVPGHLILDNTIHQVEIKPKEVATFTATNNWKQGYIQVIKKDKKSGQTVEQAGVEFEILKGSNVLETITTNQKGIAKSSLIDYGTYIIREKKEPSNYTIATLTKEQSITENGKIYEVVMFNEPVLGQIDLSKVDNETGKVSQGDATLKGAIYTLKANKNILNPANKEVIYHKDEVISKKNIGNAVYGDVGQKTVDSNFNITWNNLPLGEYRIEEVKAPKGYLIDEDHTVLIEKTSSNKQLEIKNVTSTEQVIKGQLEIAKAGTDGASGIIDGLADVEFTMKLKSEVDTIGWDKARTYSVIITDSKGKGISGKIPYGVYQVKETKTPGNYAPAGDFFVDINIDQEIEYRMVNNTPFKAWLKIVKLDENDNKVTLSGAIFKIKDEKGNYVTQKVGLFFEKDEWTTDKNGMVALDDMLLKGHYTIEEVKAPNGFLLGNSFDFEVSSNNPDLEFDKDMDPIITVEFTNEKPDAEIILNKTFEDNKDTEGAVFRLTAVNDVIDSTDGKIIYEKGDSVSVNGASDGLYTVKNGKISITGLPLNPAGKTVYQLKEVETLDGYVMIENPIIYEFNIKDDKTKSYMISHNAHNRLSESYFSKTDIGGKEIKGGTYKVIDKETQEVIDEWISNGRTRQIKGLVFDRTYIFIEDLTPLGYTQAKDIEFTYTENKQHITMVDTIVQIQKKDVEDNFVEGATLQIVSNKTKNIVDQWETTNTPHKVDGLKVGETYSVYEMKTPKGYVTANPIEFTVSDSEDMTIDILNKSVKITKVDQNQKPVEKAVLQIVDRETNEIVEEWMSDETGEHFAENLKINGKYRLIEVNTPDNYLPSTPIDFEVSPDKDQTIIMTDIKTDIVEISKKDATDHEELEGAKLQIKDEAGNIIEEWISTKEAHFVRLNVSSKYTLIETIAPEGYEIAGSIEFIIDDNGDVVQKVEMFDERTPTVIVKTSDEIPDLLFGVMGACGLVGIIFLRKRGKDNEQ